MMRFRIGNRGTLRGTGAFFQFVDPPLAGRGGGGRGVRPGDEPPEPPTPRVRIHQGPQHQGPRSVRLCAQIRAPGTRNKRALFLRWFLLCCIVGR